MEDIIVAFIYRLVSAYHFPFPWVACEESDVSGPEVVGGNRSVLRAASVSANAA